MFKLANNAGAHLAAPLAIDGTTIVLVESEIGPFPALDEGEWFPLTLADAAGVIEIVKVTSRASNLLTVERAQESTSASAFDTGARAEIRMTAGVVAALRDEVATATSETETAMAALEASLNASMATLESETADSIAALEAMVASELAVAMSGFLPPGFGPIPWSRTSAPTGWIFADGRTLLSDTTYTDLRAAYIADSFPFGQDGSGNPKIPDKRGRAAVGKDDMGGTAAGRVTTVGSGVDGATLGAVGGSQSHTLTTAQMPGHAHTASTASAGSHTHAATTATGGSHSHGGSTDTEAAHTHTASTATGGSHTHTVACVDATGSLSLSGSAGNIGTGTVTSSSHAGHTHTVTVNSGGSHSHSITSDTHSGHTHTMTVPTAPDHTHTVTVNTAGGDGAHQNMQPSLVLNFILKV